MNSSDSWKEISALYSEALTFPTAERKAFVSRACGGNEAVRQQLESLLDCHDEAHHILDSPAADVLAQDIAAEAVPLIGRQLGAYRIDAALAAGGMGEVYQATDTRLRRPVAIKILPQLLRHDPTLREHFEREAQAIAALRHPHICVLYDTGCADGIDFLVMELLEGETIANRLLRGPLSFLEVVRHAIEIAEALVAIHHRGMVHRDLKPSNVMLTETGAKLLDFGLAKGHHFEHAALPGPHDPAAMIATAAAGTLSYMAPEQVRGQYIDHRADIFAFGALIFEMLGGRKAFDGPTPQAVATAVLEGTPAPLSAVPQALEFFLLRCLEKDPKRRWQTADGMLRSLRTVVQSLGKEATSTSSRLMALGAIGAAIAIAVALLVLRSPLGEGGADPREISGRRETQAAPTGATPPNKDAPAAMADAPPTSGEATHSREVQPPVEDKTPDNVAATPQPEELPARVNATVGVSRRESAESSPDPLLDPTLSSGLPTDRRFAHLPLPSGGLSPSGPVNWHFGASQPGLGAVWLHLSVLDRANRHVLDLERESVAVLEDGVARRISFFTDRQPPLAVSLVFDKSAGTIAELPAVMEALSQFVDRRGPDNLAQIVSFTDRITVTPASTRSLDDLKRAIGAEAPGQSVSLRNALFITLKQHQKLRADEPNLLRREAIIVFSTAEDDASLVSEDQVLALARRTDAAIHVLAMGESPQVRRDLPMLRALTNDTGGELLFVSRPAEVASAYRWIASDLTSQYVLAYDSRKPVAPVSARHIAVQISRPDVVARTRRVYYPQVTR